MLIHSMSGEMANEISGETYAFQAEINQLLSLIINAFYSNKDVFVRELVSNASDAIDKIRYQSLTDSSVLGDDANLTIRIIPDQDTKTLTIEDNGIGMDKDALIKNLGTIAHSGTRAFIESVQSGQQADLSLIGQFGVGFYSAFLVADKVTVVSKPVGGEAHVWESAASGSFVVRPANENDPVIPSRGTKVILHLKDDQQGYLEENKLRTIIQTHSGYCSFPIMCMVEREEEVEEEEPAKQGEEQTIDDVKEDEEGKVEDVTEEEKKDTDEIKEPKKIKVKKFEKFNKHHPIWMRKPDEVTADEYSAFYKSFANDWEDQLHHKHFSVDGSVQFRALLFIPQRPPYDLFMGKGEDKKRDNIKLYVKKVLIMDETNDLLPEYLSFVKGIVDSDDLPLNVSREMLQQNSVMRVIKKNLVKKVVDMMTELSEGIDEDAKKKWRTFYSAFNKSIKLGIHEDEKNREKLINLLRFKTSKFSGDEDLISFKDYVSRMKEGQKNIYYITGEHLNAVRSSPFIQKLVKKGFEVLYLIDPIDEYMVQSIREYDGKQLVCCSKDGFEIETTEGDKEAFEALKKEFAPVCEKMKEILGSKVIDVRLTDVLDDNTPCVITSDKYGWSANMERLMKAQALRMNDMMDMMHSRRILELNADHSIVKGLKDKLVSEDETQKQSAKKIIDLLYDTVTIDSGFSVSDPSKYARKIYNLISLGMSGEDDEDETIDIPDSIDESSDSNEKAEDITQQESSPLEEVD